MIRIFRLPLLILTMATCFWLATVGKSAPVLPQKRSLSDQARSLARIKQLHVEVAAKKGELALIGMTSDQIENMLIERVEAAGIAIVPDAPDTAKLLFTVLVQTEERVPTGLVCQFGLTLEQNVQVDGIKGSLKVPTFLVSYVGLEHADEAIELAPRLVNMVAGEFVKTLLWAKATRKPA